MFITVIYRNVIIFTLKFREEIRADEFHLNSIDSDENDADVYVPAIDGSRESRLYLNFTFNSASMI